MFLVSTKNIKNIEGDLKEIRVHENIPISNVVTIYVLDKDKLEWAKNLAKEHGIKCPIKYNPGEMERIDKNISAKEIKFVRHILRMYKDAISESDKRFLKKYNYSDNAINFMVFSVTFPPKH